MATQSVIISWGMVLTAGVAIYYYYAKESRPRRPARKSSAADPGRDKAAHARDAAGIDTAASSSVEGGKKAPKQNKRKNKKKKQASQDTSRSSSRAEVAPVEAPSVEPRDADLPDDEESAISNAELAKRMIKMRTGTEFKVSDKSKGRVKTKKQSEASEDKLAAAAAARGQRETPSNSTGPEPNDDVSPGNSPSLEGAVTPPTDSTADSTGVSDMLEPPATTSQTLPTDPTGVADMLEPPAPTHQVLRVTAPVQPVVDRPSQPKAPAKEKLTKKQRQRAAKRDAEKAEKAEQEKARREAEERQRRTAREAEGRPARNGDGWTYASGVSPEAWKSGAKQETPVPTTAVNAPLLDTLEGAGSSDWSIVETHEAKRPVPGQDTGTTLKAGTDHTSKDAKAAVDGDAVSKPSTNWSQGVPPEEEQMRLLQEQQDEQQQWKTVANKKGSKKATMQAQDESKSD